MIPNVNILVRENADLGPAGGLKYDPRTLWISHQGTAPDGDPAAPIKAISGVSRLASGTPTPLTTIIPSRGSTPSVAPMPLGISFAPDGALWFCTWQTGPEYLRRIPPENLYNGGAIDREIRTTFGNDNSIEFDQAGNLWLNDANGNVGKYTPAQLASSSPTTPVVPSLTVAFGAAAGIDLPNVWVPQMALGPDGWMYGVVYSSPAAIEPHPGVVAVSPAQLAAGGTITPAVCEGSNFAGNPDGLAFDDQGRVWFSFYENSTLGGFSLESIQAGGNPEPEIVISSPNLVGPTGIIFDRFGNLWAANYDRSDIICFERSTLKSGSIPASIRIETVTPQPAFMVLHGV